MLKKIKSIVRWSFFYKIYKSTESNVAKLVFWNPSKKLIVIWVTWTDWKSTTSSLIHKILNDNLWKTALFTTVNQKFGDETMENMYKMTNISAWKTQEFLKQALEKNCKYCVLEVSSHWIDQKRVANIEYDVAVLTNITEEHLDYHKTFYNYANIKKQLFQWVLRNHNWKKIAVFNKDDDIWKQWAEEIPFNTTFTYSIFTNSNIKADNIKEYIDHTEFTLKYLSKEYKIKTKLLWAFNVSNIIASIATWYTLKINFEDMIKSIESFERVNWRLNSYIDEKGAYYFIDYAHTPAWLNAVLTFLNKIKTWKIITVFGAPWMRDKMKRPKMWDIVSKFSDIIIITDDDPDTEDRMEIIKDIQKWVKRQLWDDYWVMPDRELAVELAYNIAIKDDIVLIAGKWHEKVQLTNSWKREYSDLWTLEQLCNIKAI